MECFQKIGKLKANSHTSHTENDRLATISTLRHNPFWGYLMSDVLTPCGWEADGTQNNVEHKSFSKQLVAVELPVIDFLTEQKRQRYIKAFPFSQSTLAAQTPIIHTSYHNDLKCVRVCLLRTRWRVNLPSDMKLCFPPSSPGSCSLLFQILNIVGNPASSLHISSEFLHFLSSLHLIWISDHLLVYFPINYILNDVELFILKDF